MAAWTRPRKIQRLQVDNISLQSTVFAYQWGGEGKENGKFEWPTSVAVRMEGMVYVSDFNNHRIQCFTSDGVWVRKWGAIGQKDGEFTHPISVAISACTEVYNSILSAIKSVPVLAVFPPGLLPICAAYVGTERIYVADQQNHRIQVFTPDGKFILKWGSFGHGQGRFVCPNRCVVSCYRNSLHNELVYVSDQGHYIQIFDSNGKFVDQWGGYGSGDKQFNNPRGIGISRCGYIYIADFGNDRITRCSPNNIYDRWPCSTDSFTSPSDVLVDDDNEMIYVADSANHCVRRYRPNGEQVKKWGGKKGNGDGQFAWPRGMAMGTNGIMYIADQFNDKIVALRVN